MKKRKRRRRRSPLLARMTKKNCISISDFPYGLIQDSNVIPKVITQFCFLWIAFTFMFHVMDLSVFHSHYHEYQLRKKFHISVWPDMGHMPISEPIHLCCRGISYFNWLDLGREPPSEQEFIINCSRTTWMGSR